LTFTEYIASVVDILTSLLIAQAYRKWRITYKKDRRKISKEVFLFMNWRRKAELIADFSYY